MGHSVSVVSVELSLFYLVYFSHIGVGGNLQLVKVSQVKSASTRHSGASCVEHALLVDSVAVDDEGLMVVTLLLLASTGVV